MGVPLSILQEEEQTTCLQMFHVKKDSIRPLSSTPFSLEAPKVDLTSGNLWRVLLSGGLGDSLVWQLAAGSWRGGGTVGSQCLGLVRCHCVWRGGVTVHLSGGGGWVLTCVSPRLLGERLRVDWSQGFTLVSRWIIFLEGVRLPAVQRWCVEMEGVVSRVVYGPCCYNTGGLPLCDLLFKTLILHPDCFICGLAPILFSHRKCGIEIVFVIRR
ncbi:hypothetical protein YC2023_058801 [Brassica napus]